MSDPRERVLEQALERLLASPESEAANARRIAAAWERKEPAPSLEGLELAEEDPPITHVAAPTSNGVAHSSVPRPKPSTSKRPTLVTGRRVAAAALAASLLGAFVLWKLGQEPPLPPPVAGGADGPSVVDGSSVADGPDVETTAPPTAPLVAHAALPVALQRAGAELAAPEIRAGDAVRTGAEPAELVLEGCRSELVLAPLSLLAFRDSEPELATLVIGEAHLVARAHLAFDLGFARLDAEPGARVAFALEPDGTAPPDGVHPADWLRDAGAEPPLVLRVAVADGFARLSGERWGERLAPGDVLVLRAGENPPSARVVEVREMVTARVERLWPGRAKGTGLYGPWLERGMQQLDVFIAYLDKEPAHWTALAELALADAADPERPRAVKATWILIALASDSPGATKLARELWLAAPDAFETGQVVALAERGAFELEREARALVFERDGTAEELLLPASWLAAAGEERGRAILREILAAPAGEGLGRAARLDRRWIAASALAHGGEDAPWQELQRKLAADVEAALELGQEDHAARLVLLAEFFRRHLAEPPAYGLVELAWLRYFGERRQKLESADDIRAALEALR